ncbi:MAG: hypothetical protein BRD41_00895 [Bacteroidetes bacterium QS_1_63_11]|nr:MAG: hypothetical protein BRD41_00895 [Bacteroidetes bacterium QS_1_63_11]
MSYEEDYYLREDRKPETPQSLVEAWKSPNHSSQRESRAVSTKAGQPQVVLFFSSFIPKRVG